MPIGLTKIKRIGGTTILIKRKVLEQIQYPFYKLGIPKTMEEAFEVGPMTHGSDYYFCDKVCDAGFEIYADPEILCKHIKLINLLDLVIKYKE